MIKENNYAKLNEYIEFLNGKGRIIGIKDTSKAIKIRFSIGFIFYFLSILGVSLIALTIYLVQSTIINSKITSEQDIIVAVSVAIFSVILLGVALYERANIILKVTYPSKHELKINHKKLDINKRNCYIYIAKEYETNLNCNIGTPSYGKFYKNDKYLLTIKSGKSKRCFKITNKTIDKLNDFIYNFDYDFQAN